MTLKIDRSAEIRMLRSYTPDAVTYILQEAAKHGGQEAAKVMRAVAPKGTSERPSQYYRRNNLPHGTFRKSVKAARIRRKGKDTVGYVVGPVGSKGFTRHWIELGTSHSRANPWVERVAAAALSVAQRGSEAVLALYVRNH